VSQEAEKLCHGPLVQVRTLLGLVDSRRMTCAKVKSITEQNIEDIRQRVKDLMRLERILCDMASQCRGDEASYCPIMDALTAPEEQPTFARHASWLDGIALSQARVEARTSICLRSPPRCALVSGVFLRPARGFSSIGASVPPKKSEAQKDDVTDQHRHHGDDGPID
jgi:hypothetical protein